MQHPFKLKNAALLMALAAVYPLTVHSAAGVAQFTVGDVNVRRGNAAVPLTKGQPIESGDSVVTGGASQAQIRFTDGGLVSLAPNTQFNITNYANVDDPGKDSFAVNLLRGGMRAITGLIGKRNRENYKVTTSTATIGIRGSGFSANYNSDGSLNVAGEQDTIQVCTQAGCVDLTVGEIVRVTSADSVPTRTNLRTNLPPLAISPQTGAQLNQPEFELPDLGITGVLTGVSAMFASFGQNNSYFNTSLLGGPHPSTGVGTFANSLMTQHVSSLANLPGNNIDGDFTFRQVGSGSDSFGTLGSAIDPAFIGWGYWSAGEIIYAGPPQISAEDSNLFDDVHYVVGRPTPYEQMPLTGTAQYALVGGTNPTAFNYNTNTRLIGQLVDAGLSVEFSTGLVHAVINTSFNTPNNGVVPVQISDVGFIDGSQFFALGCQNGFFAGFFAGDQASRAGLLYRAENDIVGVVSGAAAFVRGGIAPSITDMIAMVGEEEGNYPIGPFAGTSFMVGNALVAHAAINLNEPLIYNGGSLLVAATSPVTDFGNIGNRADGDYVGWGYWARGTSFSPYGGQSSLVGVHYVVGQPTPFAQMPQTGSAQYTLAGGTSPTANYDGDRLVGQLVSAGLSVEFATGLVHAIINTSFVTPNNGTVAVQISDSGYVDGNQFYAQGNGNSYFSGFFSGNQASRAGLLYYGYNNIVGNVAGAAAFTRGGVAPSVTDLLAVFTDEFNNMGNVTPALAGTSFLSGNALLAHSTQDDQGIFCCYGGNSSLLVAATSPVSSSGSLGNPADANFIGWGYWAKGFRDHQYEGTSNLTGVHYIVGRPTSLANMATLTGTATYSMQGGTAPTSRYNGNSITGQLLSATLNVNFSNSTVAAQVATQFNVNGGPIPVNLTVPAASINGARFSGSGNGGSVSGIFVGDMAIRAGMVYSQAGNSGLSTVRGAVALQRGAITPPAPLPPQ